MPKRHVTIETRLGKDLAVFSYLNDYVAEYSRIKRKMWYEMTAGNYSKRFKSLAEYEKYCREHYSLLGRTVNSLVFEIQGTMLAYMELKKTELKTLEIKINNKIRKISDIKAKLDRLKILAVSHCITKKELCCYRNLKQSLYFQKNKLNKMNQKKKNLIYQIENKIYDICFGTKSQYSKQYRLSENGYKSHLKWYNDFVKSRDKNILYIGASNESFGNQMVQMTYHADTDDFSLKIRKENLYCQDEKYITIEHINFKYRKEEIKEIIQNYTNRTENKIPLTYRFHREKNKWYIQVIFSFEFEESAYCTTSRFGVCGLDYNDGFIEMAETNESGNLINTIHYDLHEHGTGNKAETEIRQVISKIVKYAENKGKDISLEKLDFKRTKAKQDKSRNSRIKNYNRMLHIFDYHRYMETMQNTALNHRVRVIFVNPKNTSKIGKQKYAYKKKLTVHQSAAFVIARKAQGYIDKLAV